MRKTEDHYFLKGLRKQLVMQLKEKGISDNKVLEAIDTIPRHYFLDVAFNRIAYEDRAFPIDANQTISQPYTVAFQTELLELEKVDKVLEIGTGSGFQTCILCAMGAKVFTIERQKALFDQTPQFAKVFGDQFPDVQFFYGDGFEGLPDLAPFDKIIITAAAPNVPVPLWDQLKVRGIMVIPVDESATVQRMLRLTKKKDGMAKRESFDEFSFVPMLQGKSQG